MEKVIKDFDVSEQNTWEDFYHSIDEDTPSTEFVGGFFPKNHVSILASKAGIGKTWYVIKLIADLSKGGTIFLSQAYYELPKKCLYFVGETNIPLINERFKMLRQEKNTENIVIIGYSELAKKSVFLDLDTREGANLIKKIIDDVKPDIVVFDSMMSFRRDDENTSQSTKDMMARLIMLAEKCHVAILATHHLRKKNQNLKVSEIDQDEIIGSSALVRMAATAFILTKRSGDTLRLQCVKSWWKNPPNILYEMKERDGLLEFDLSSEENDFTEKRLRAEKWVQTQQANGAKFTTQDIMKACNVGSTTALQVVKEKCTVFSKQGNTIIYQ